MKRCILLSLLFVFGMVLPVSAAPSQFIYDEANLLTNSEKVTLNEMAAKYSERTNTSIVILTTNNTFGSSIETYMGDFFDRMGLGYDQPNGNTVLLSIDMGNRDLYLAGFHKGESYVTSGRINTILDEITPLISSGDYYHAFQQYMESTVYYLENKPKNIFQKLWFQLVISGFLALLIVGIMVSNRGGKVTTNKDTYADSQHNGVVNSDDQYVTTHLTKVRKPKNNGGGSGGRTGGGTSYSGGGRSF
jgi:uncharacterized protein